MTPSSRHATASHTAPSSAPSAGRTPGAATRPARHLTLVGDRASAPRRSAEAPAWRRGAGALLLTVTLGAVLASALAVTMSFALLP